MNLKLLSKTPIKLSLAQESIKLLKRITQKISIGIFSTNHYLIEKLEIKKPLLLEPLRMNQHFFIQKRNYRIEINKLSRNYSFFDRLFKKDIKVDEVSSKDNADSTHISDNNCPTRNNCSANSNQNSDYKKIPQKKQKDDSIADCSTDETDYTENISSTKQQSQSKSKNSSNSTILCKHCVVDPCYPIQVTTIKVYGYEKIVKPTLPPDHAPTQQKTVFKRNAMKCAKPLKWEYPENQPGKTNTGTCTGIEDEIAIDVCKLNSCKDSLYCQWKRGEISELPPLAWQTGTSKYETLEEKNNDKCINYDERYPEQEHAPCPEIEVCNQEPFQEEEPFNEVCELRTLGNQIGGSTDGILSEHNNDLSNDHNESCMEQDPCLKEELHTENVPCVKETLLCEAEPEPCHKQENLSEHNNYLSPKHNEPCIEQADPCQKEEQHTDDVPYLEESSLAAESCCPKQESCSITQHQVDESPCVVEECNSSSILPSPPQNGPICKIICIPPNKHSNIICPKFRLVCPKTQFGHSDEREQRDITECKQRKRYDSILCEHLTRQCEKMIREANFASNPCPTPEPTDCSIIEEKVSPSPTREPKDCSITEEKICDSSSSLPSIEPCPFINETSPSSDIICNPSPAEQPCEPSLEGKCDPSPCKPPCEPCDPCPPNESSITEVQYDKIIRESNLAYNPCPTPEPKDCSIIGEKVSPSSTLEPKDCSIIEKIACDTSSSLPSIEPYPPKKESSDIICNPPLIEQPCEPSSEGKCDPSPCKPPCEPCDPCPPNKSSITEIQCDPSPCAPSCTPCDPCIPNESSIKEVECNPSPCEPSFEPCKPCPSKEGIGPSLDKYKCDSSPNSTISEQYIPSSQEETSTLDSKCDHSDALKESNNISDSCAIAKSLLKESCETEAKSAKRPESPKKDTHPAEDVCKDKDSPK